MLLGFKGRYGVYEQEKLLAIMQKTANALVKVGKIKPVELSPNWLANDQPKPPEKRGMPVWAKIGAFERSWISGYYLFGYVSDVVASILDRCDAKASALRICQPRIYDRSYLLFSLSN